MSIKTDEIEVKDAIPVIPLAKRKGTLELEGGFNVIHGITTYVFPDIHDQQCEHVHTWLENIRTKPEPTQ